MKYKLALVEYLNTLPFSEGLRLNHMESKLEVHRVTPAECALLFQQGKVDISLCPIGALGEMPSHEVCGQYCIGADGEVGTVVLLSQVPLHKIKAVRCDDHSRTSNILLQVLANKFWQQEWDYYFDADEILPESCLMIGDKVFENKNQYPFRYDLGTAWKELTGLPMVFAVWIAREGVPNELIHELDEAFETGMDFIQSGESNLEPWQVEYLLNNISYPLDDAKKGAMQLYFEWADSIAAVPVTR